MPHEVDLDFIPILVEREKIYYKALLGGKGNPHSVDPKHLEYVLPGDRLLTVDLHYTAMESEIGFPFHRLKCSIKLDGKRITQEQLSKICT